MSNDLKLNLILKAVDGMSGVVKSACRQSDNEFEKLNNTLESTASKFDAQGKKLVGFGAALIGASALNVKLASDFEKGMNNVSTLIDTNTESLDTMKQEVLKIASTSPKAISDLTDGLYSIRSAGIEASNQFKVLNGSQILATAGLSTTAEAVDVVTSAINAFKLKGIEADKVYDMFFKVVKYGKTNISEFAQGFGATAGVVAAAKIGLDEYSASVAAMTTSGLKASIAHTQLKAAIAGLSRGSKEQMTVFKKLHVKSFSELVQKSGGMVNAFNEIKNAVNSNQAKLIALLGSVEAYNAVLSLTGANNRIYLQTLNDMRYGADSLSNAYAKQIAGLDNELKLIANSMQAVSIKLGNALIPTVHVIGSAVQKFTNILNGLPDGVINFASILTAGTGVVSLFAGTALIMGASIIRSVITIRKALRGFSIASWANPALLPILGITAAIVGLSVAAAWAYKKFEGFRNICIGVGAAIKLAGATIALLGTWVANIAIKAIKTISPMTKFGLTIISWVHPIGLAYHAIKGLCQIVGSLVQKAGGLRTIGINIKNWADDKTNKVNKINSNIKNNPKIDGSHKTGLDYVPYDGYMAETHEGEAILSAPEADRWRKNYRNNNSDNNSLQKLIFNYNPSITLSGELKTAKDEFKKLLIQHKDEILSIILNYLKRCEAREY